MLKKIRVAELLFVLYFWSFVFLRPYLITNLSSSSLILGGFTGLLLILFFFGVAIRSIRVNSKVIAFALIILFLFFFDSNFRNNNYSSAYLWEYLYSGLIPLVFFSGVVDFRALLRYFSYLAVLAVILYGLDPLMGYPIFGDYMTYGFKLALPGFIGVFLGCHYFKIRWFFIFEVLIFLSLILFANRSSLIATILFVVLFNFIITVDKRKLLFKKIIPFIILSAFIYYNFLSILKYTIEILSSYGYESYALRKYLFAIDLEAGDSILSGRDNIWEQALNMINISPLLGSGLGSFQSIYNNYSHNVVLDVLLFFGVIGFLIFLILIYRSSKYVLRANSEFKIFALLFFSMWFPKLLFSLVFTEDISFWCYLALPFLFVDYTKSHRIFKPS